MGDLEKLQREVRTLRRMVYALATCALALAAAAVTSCAHQAAPMTRLSLVDGTHAVTIEASGIHISDGDHRVDLLEGGVHATDELQVLGRNGSVEILPNQVGIHNDDGQATLGVHAALGPELQLASGAHTTVNVHAGSGYAGLKADAGTRTVSLEASTDMSVVQVATHDGPRASLWSRDDTACTSVDRNRPGTPGGAVDTCSPR